MTISLDEPRLVSALDLDFLPNFDDYPDDAPRRRPAQPHPTSKIQIIFLGIHIMVVALLIPFTVETFKMVQDFIEKKP